ncbi:hypothetical protein BCR37DRAFT_376857 [Protomyces lactucae-debilis]|uniref:Uncharacterized protein n=1 Tax=Protomyces lactucae-debilis TaxID=2754530 RepID=A0A1Y2FQS9_PROLT|nr:uncharacterized protein BCR37DRAFT_376857 [Protomyces lactucae-debilis]ORY86289.1 hypothetical protein BCR37DRAFT_376857 [Protomyces lactucae-debilis]
MSILLSGWRAAKILANLAGLLSRALHTSSPRALLVPGRSLSTCMRDSSRDVDVQSHSEILQGVSAGYNLLKTTELLC